MTASRGQTPYARRAAAVAVGSRLLLAAIAFVTTYAIGVQTRALYLRDPAHAERLQGLAGRLLGPWAHWDGVWFVRIAADGSAAAAPHDPTRAITQNRQPGKCCDTGCTVPGTPVMVDLPTVESALPSRRQPD